MDLVVLVVSFAVILAGAELFTNGVEWFGHKLELAEGAIGSVLAAVGTALPETMIPLIAIVFGGGVAASEVGVGAILGAPFMLSTLAMFVTGAAVLLMRKRRANREDLVVDPGVLGHDMAYFAVAYAIAIGAALLPGDLIVARRLTAVVLIGIYVVYVVGHLRAEAAQAAELAPLRFHRLDRRGPAHPAAPRFRIVNVQVLVALVCIVGGAWGFVSGVKGLSASFGLNGTLLALIVAPIATELPEKLNSIIWVRQGKDTLAMGNITGAMVFQSAFPTSVGLVFAPQIWSASGAGIAFASAGITFLSSAAIILPMLIRRRLDGRALLVGGCFYVVYLGVVLASLAGGNA
ncbi:MAG: sodium:calcium antiporter [Candidatus Limnocylindrales bacterium]|jgi:cation:H+ antiporter